MSPCQPWQQAFLSPVSATSKHKGTSRAATAKAPINSHPSPACDPPHRCGNAPSSPRGSEGLPLRSAGSSHPPAPAFSAAGERSSQHRHHPRPVLLLGAGTGQKGSDRPCGWNTSGTQTALRSIAEPNHDHQGLPFAFTC